MSVAYDVGLVESGDPLGLLAQGLSYQKREELHSVMGHAVALLWKKHLVEYSENNPNLLGGKRTFFYRDAALSARSEATQSSAVVTVSQTGIKLQFYGGTVEPGKNTSSYSGKPTSKLSIPAVAEAHGKRASEFDLIALWGHNGPYALAERITRRALGNKKPKKLKKDETTYITPGGKLKGATGGRIMFWLADSATIKPHPEIIPDEAAITTAAIEAGWKFILRHRGKAGST